jgi:hypothetical protein
MKCSVRGTAAFLAIFGFQWAPLEAGAVELTVDPAQSSISALMGIFPFCSPICPTESLVFSGTVTADILVDADPTHGLVISSMQIHSGDIGLSDGLWYIPVSYVIIIGTSTGVLATLETPLIAGTPVALQTSELDLQGSLMTFNQGTVAAEGPATPIPVIITQDLTIDPLVHTFQSGGVATATSIQAGPGVYDIEIEIPVSMMFDLWPNPEPAGFLELDGGSIVLTGTVSVPPIPPLVPVGAPASLAVAVLIIASAASALRKDRGRIGIASSSQV